MGWNTGSFVHLREGTRPLDRDDTRHPGVGIGDRPGGLLGGYGYASPNSSSIGKGA